MEGTERKTKPFEEANNRPRPGKQLRVSLSSREERGFTFKKRRSTLRKPTGEVALSRDYSATIL